MKTNVTIINEQDKTELTPELKKLIRKACRTTLSFEHFPQDAAIDVTLVDDKRIRELNLQFRNIDRSTDVLSFPLGENNEYDINPITGEAMLGDVVISAEHALMQADTYGHSPEREFAFLTVHSMLHLLGYDHVNSESEEKIMFDKQEEILGKMGLSVKG